MPPSVPELWFDDLTLGYERHPAVHHLHGVVQSGTLLAVVGPNGSGKSTLLRAIAGELAPLQGRIGHRHGRRLAYLPQIPQLDRSFPVRVRDLVALGLWHELGPFGGLSHQQRHRVDHALAQVGLERLGERPIETLSGGQFQRALFARLILQDAALILLDEPFAAVDELTTRDLMAVIDEWHRQGRTVLAVLHDMALVRQRFPETLLLARECLGWGPTATVLTDTLIARARSMPEGFDPAAPLCLSRHEGHVHG
jgi:zinc/manganese transport system ATP-binding protein